MHESLTLLDEIRLNFSSEGLFVLNITLAFIMFGVALGIKVSHFKDVILSPKAAIVGFLSQFLLLPAVTYGIILLINDYITPTIAMGMILVASCPGGNVSNFISSLAKGNVALSVTLTAIATLGAIILTPLNFSIWGGFYTRYLSRVDSASLLRPIEINPYAMFETVFILLGIPLVIGMLVNHFLPKITRKINSPIRAISLLAFAAMVVMAFMKNYDYFLAHIKYVFILVLIHNTLGFLSGNLFAQFFKIGGANRRAITIETGIQNSGLALVLLFNPKIFPPDINNGGMAFIAAWWGIWHILAGLALAGVWSRWKPKN
ncbi:MAG: bile acid:sodium symporter family protein [Bacteroidales bacterium]|nr:bile acid:sodium symporter family protein [Bacteroidales bacterium]